MACQGLTCIQTLSHHRSHPKSNPREADLVSLIVSIHKMSVVHHDRLER